VDIGALVLHLTLLSPSTSAERYSSCGALVSTLPLAGPTFCLYQTRGGGCVDHPLALLTGSIRAVDCPDKLCRSAAPWEAGRDATRSVSSRVRLCATGRLIVVALLVSLKPLIMPSESRQLFLHSKWMDRLRTWLGMWLVEMLSEDDPTFTSAGSRAEGIIREA